MPIYIPAKKIAEKYGFTVGQLKVMRHRKQGPVFKKINGRAYYRMDDIERWLKEQDKSSYS